MSVTEKAIEMVNIDRLYNHVLSLEGIRHPLDSFAALIKGAEYIENTFQQQGLDTNRHYFSIKEMTEEFYNIEGLLEPQDQIDLSQPTLLVTSHYDTVYSTPGADDNTSAVAIMLEIARVLKQLDYDKNVIFVSFNLEEYSPYLQNKVRKLGVKYGVYDDSYRFVSWSLRNCYDQFKKLISASGVVKPFLDENEWEIFEASVKQELNHDQLDFFRKWNQLHREAGKNDPIGSFAILGSSAYVKNVLENKMNIEGVINLEMVGFTSSKPHSQSFPPGVTLEALDRYNIDENLMIGNFVQVVSDDTSERLAKSFIQNCKLKKIDLPCVRFAPPLKYETIKQNIPTLLSSDHAPFWKHGFPAIMLTDTAKSRNPYYHTGGDTINTLDFPFMKKICQATLATIIELQKDHSP